MGWFDETMEIPIRIIAVYEELRKVFFLERPNGLLAQELGYAVWCVG